MDIKPYQDLAGGWRWRIVAGNGRIIADSAEAYATKSNVLRAANRFISEAHAITLVEQEG